MSVAPISVHGLAVELGGQRALRDVTFDVREGDFVGIVGPNGGGKTTLLRAILGLQRPASGEARLFGTHARRFREFSRIGYVPQHAIHVDPRFPASAFEVALLGRVGMRGPLRRMRREDRSAASQALNEVGAAHLADRLIGTLSGGERQRVFLAKALASEPELLILDEPTTGVDPKGREDFYHLIDHLNHIHDMTVVLVSHDLHALEVTVHRLIALNQTVVFDGKPRDFAGAGGLGGAYGIDISHEHEPHGEG